MLEPLRNIPFLSKFDKNYINKGESLRLGENTMIHWDISLSTFHLALIGHQLAKNSPKKIKRPEMPLDARNDVNI